MGAAMTVPSGVVDLSNSTIIPLTSGYIVQDPDSTICKPGTFDLFLPGMVLWSPTTLAIIYSLFLCYLFIGIAIIADKFMAAIMVTIHRRVPQLLIC